MPRYVATQQIWHGNVLAYTAGQRVPETNVAAHGYDTAGLVEEVADDHRGDRPDLAVPEPDTTPRRRDTATEEATADPAGEVQATAQPTVDGQPAPAPAATKATRKTQPATGDMTSTDQPVTEA